MITLTVNLDVHHDHLDTFLNAIEENAFRSFTDEAGCVYFDVCRSLRDEHHFTFYEVYEDMDALKVHRASPHFSQWRQVADQCVVEGSQENAISSRLFHHVR